MMKITQQQLLHLADAQRALREAQGLVKTCELACESAEGPVRQGLRAGAPIQRGALTAVLVRSERRIVAWRKVVEEKLGVEEAERVAAATEPREYFAVVVSPVNGGA